MFPIRCYTCNCVLAQHHDAYRVRTRAGESPAVVLDALHVNLMCCRRMFLSHVESLITNQLDYPNVNVVLDGGGTTLYRRCAREHVVPCD